MLLEPTTIAVIGASPEEEKLGHYILKNIQSQGFKGAIYPINPKHEEILGLKAYTSVTEIDEPIDMAVIVTPAPTVVDLAKECASKRVQCLVVISAGFGEIGTKECYEREQALLQICADANMRLIGPNCLGILRPSIGLNASFATNLPRTGTVALISQSGAMAVALMDQSIDLHIGYSLVASIGNKADMDESDFLELCEADPQTKVIGLYLESIKNGKRFMTLAQRIAPHKPIVLIKSGVSKQGSAAVSSHTGALAGSGAAIEALCRQTGVRQTKTSGEFLDELRILSTQPQLASPNIAIVTNAGGPGVLATDEAERVGLSMPSMSDRTAALLTAALPSSASIKNPIDIIGDALADRYDTALAACASDPGVDGLVVILTPQIMTPCTAIAQSVIALRTAHPLLPVATSFMGSDSVREAKKLLEEHGIPNFATPEEAVRALACLRMPAISQYVPIVGPADDDRSSAAAGMLKGKRGLLDESLINDLLSLYGLPVMEQALAQTEADALSLAEQIGYPIVAKISSPDILHKTDMGGVHVNIRSPKALTRAYREIMANAKTNAPTAGIRGILIQKFLPAGNEFIVGAVRDPSFGPLVMVGLGGIYTELFNDTSFRIAPLGEPDAYDMLTELKSWKLLKGMRGQQASDVDAIASAIAGVERLMLDCPTIHELDLNPILIFEKSVAIADAKVIVR